MPTIASAHHIQNFHSNLVSLPAEKRMHLHFAEGNPIQKAQDIDPHRVETDSVHLITEFESTQIIQCGSQVQGEFSTVSG